ncbi:MAG TPA: type II CAAX endopeptidase family protein [Mobilitalea sp.]|nr:type II CAAX endopeptidase family protein [Mobilitalea sp.]
MKHFLRFLTAVLPLLTAILIQYIVINCLIFFTSGELSDQVFYLYSALAILVCGIVFFFWYRKESEGEPRGSFKNLAKPKNLIYLAILGISSQFFFSGILSLLTPFFIKIFTQYADVVENLTSGNEIVVLLLVLFVAPVTEELIFRGVILHMANRYITFLGANILQAVLFGIYHGNIVQGFYASLLGFLLGVIYYKYKTIFASIFLHMVINGSSFLTYYLPDYTIYYFIVMIVGGLLFAAMLLLIQPTRRFSGITVTEDDLSD